MTNSFFHLLKALFFCFALLFASSIWAEGILEGKHIGAGINCAACHAESPPAIEVPTEKCETCHGDTDAVSKKPMIFTPILIYRTLAQ